MTEQPQEQFACPHCGRRFRWKAERAGRAAACVCGGRFRIPREPNTPAEPLKDKSQREQEKQQPTDHADTAPPSDSATEQTAPEETSDTATPPQPPPLPGKQPKDNPADRISDDDVYELNLPEEEVPPVSAVETGPPTLAAPPIDGKCPNCNQPIKPDARICIKCGFNLQEGRKLQTDVSAPAQPETDDAEPGAEVADPSDDDAHRSPAPVRSSSAVEALYGQQAGTEGSVGARAAADESERQQKIDLYAPGIMIGVALFVRILYQFAATDTISDWLFSVLRYLLMDLVIWTPLTFAAMLLSAKLLGTWFGSLLTMPYKLLGIVMSANIVWTLLDGTCLGAVPIFGWMVIGLAFACVYAGLLPILFDMETSEMLITATIIIVFQFLAVALGFLIPLWHIDFFMWLFYQ